MTSTLDHVAIAVRSLEKTLPLYEEALGLKCSGFEEVPTQKVRVAVLPIGETRIELLEPTAPDGPIARFIDRKGEGLHHIALRVPGVADELVRLDAAGVPLIDREPRSGAEGARIAFLHPKALGGVLAELVERPDGPEH
jgi:methylmalonyl-CoA epimerase